MRIKTLVKLHNRIILIGGVCSLFLSACGGGQQSDKNSAANSPIISSSSLSATNQSKVSSSATTSSASSSQLNSSMQNLSTLSAQASSTQLSSVITSSAASISKISSVSASTLSSVASSKNSSLLSSSKLSSSLKSSSAPSSSIVSSSSLSSSSSSSTSSAPVANCNSVQPGLAAGAPTVAEGTWVNITPPNNFIFGDGQTLIAQGVAVDPCNRSIIYWGNTPQNNAFGGLFKSTDAGTTWRRIGLVDTTTKLDMPLKIRIDPNNPQHLYVGDGVRGGTWGFWVSKDGGEHFTKPQGWIDISTSQGILIDDVYDIAVDPADFNHVLVSSHSPWSWSNISAGAGIMETKDGGETWTSHALPNAGYGHAVYFLYDPQKGIGDNKTWMVGTQDSGHFRTEDGGKNWSAIPAYTIYHGGGCHYYSKNKVLYLAALHSILRSTDNGKTFTELLPISHGYTCVWGDGTYLYTAPGYSEGKQAFKRSLETDGLNWSSFGSSFDDSGPYEMAYDEVNNLLYASNWFQGLWVIKPSHN